MAEYAPLDATTDFGGGQLIINGTFNQTGGLTSLDGGQLEAGAVTLNSGDTGGRLDLGGGTIDVIALAGDVTINCGVLRKRQRGGELCHSARVAATFCTYV